MNSELIAIAGLPGSGKTTIMDDFRLKGYSIYDDIYANRGVNLPKAKADAQQGKRVAISDIMFCKSEIRQQIEREIGGCFAWIFTENDPWQCEQNCIYRVEIQKQKRDLKFEKSKIRELSPIYKPLGDVRPVPVAGAQSSTK
jgi:hypothetical protein